MNNYFRDFQYIDDLPDGPRTYGDFNNTLYPFKTKEMNVILNSPTVSFVEKDDNGINWFSVPRTANTVSTSTQTDQQMIDNHYTSIYYFNPVDNKKSLTMSKYDNLQIETDYLLSVSMTFKFSYSSFETPTNRAILALGNNENYSIPLMYAITERWNHNDQRNLTMGYNHRRFSVNASVPYNDYDYRSPTTKGEIFDLEPDEEYFLQFKIQKKGLQVFLSFYIDGNLFGSYEIQNSFRPEYTKLLPNNLIFISNDVINFKMKDFIIQCTYPQSNDFPMYSYYMNEPQEIFKTLDNVSMEYADFSKADHDEVISSDDTTDTLEAFKSDTLYVIPMGENSKQDFELTQKNKVILQNKLTFKTGEPNLIDSLINETQSAGVTYDFNGKYTILFRKQTDIAGIVYNTIPLNKKNSYVENPNQYEVIKVIDNQKSVTTSLNEFTKVKNDSRYGMFDISLVNSDVSGNNDWLDSLMTLKICFNGLPKENTDNQVLHWIRNEEDDIFLDIFLHPNGKIALTYEQYAYVSDVTLNDELTISYYRKDDIREMKINDVVVSEISLDDYSSMTFPINDTNNGISYDVISLVFTYNEKE